MDGLDKMGAAKKQVVVMNTGAITRFILYFSAIYGLVLLTGQSADEWYAEYFRNIGRKTVAPFFSKGAIGFFEIKKPEEPKFSTNIRIANKKDYEDAMRKRQPYKSADISVSSWYSGYLPTMLTLALILSIPGVTRRKKAIASGAGLVIIHVFIFIKLYTQLLYEFERNEWTRVVHFSPFGQQVMDNLYYLFVQSMGLNFAVPILICIVTLFWFKRSG